MPPKPRLRPGVDVNRRRFSPAVKYDGVQDSSASGNIYGIAESPFEFAHLMNSKLPSTEKVQLIGEDKIDWKTICIVCDGKGHPAKCKRNDGTIQKCLTLDLGTKPPELIPQRNATNAVEEPALLPPALIQEMAQMKKQADENHSLLKAIIGKFKRRSNRPSRPSSRASASSIECTMHLYMHQRDPNNHN